MMSDPSIQMIIQGIDKKLDKLSGDQEEVKTRLARIEQHQEDQKEICADHKRDIIQHDKRLNDLEIGLGKAQQPNWKHMITAGAIGGMIGFACSKLNIPLPKMFGG